ncbi:MAG: group II intron reverse transcriptase domain-containing protein [Proteobacteria bacterium]|nr:group II intron reverse transcriptase domain-containing protein [Candidatus Enterousia scatequi]
MENLDLAAHKAVLSKKSKACVREFLAHRDMFLSRLRMMLLNGSFHTSAYYEKRIFEPKERIIYVLPLYPDHIVHHAIINILGPIWHREFIRDSFACIPGRGLHTASRRIMSFIRRNRYVLHCDIRKFYPSINHNIMMDILRRKIKDSRFLSVLRDIVYSCGDETNIPIGNLTSQWLGNVYLNELDKYIKQTLHWRDYIRYCDDFCLFSDDKVALHDVESKIRDFLRDRLRLTFSKCAIYPTSRGIEYIGYRHFKKYILLRRRTARKIRRRVTNIGLHNDLSELSRGQLASAYGWSRWANSYNFRRDLCASCVSLGVPRHTIDCIRYQLGLIPKTKENKIKYKIPAIQE